MARPRKRRAREAAGRGRSRLAAGSIVLAPRKLPEVSLSERVYRALKRDIITGVYPPGEPLSEKDLAERYESSRTPVREAAVRLQQDRLLRVVPNRGYFITKISVQDLTELYEYRGAVECASAELAAMKGNNPELMERLQQLAQTDYKIDDRESYVHFIEMDTDFHLGIALLARNPLLLHAVETVRSQMERIMYAAIDIGYYGELPVREHCGILDAIRLRDHEAARRLMHDHIFGSEDKVRRLAGGSTR